MADRSIRTSAALLALVPFLALVWRFDFVCDDAYISFRYALNLVQGHGLRFNLGEQPPVEGYSEFLWVLVVASGMKLGLAPWVVARALSVAAGALLVLITSRALVRVAGERRGAALGGSLLLGTLAPLAVWSTSGMGTAPFLLAAIGLHMALFCRRPRPFLAVVAAVGVVLLRADGAYWVAVSGATGLLLGGPSSASTGRPEDGVGASRDGGGFGSLRRAALLASLAGAAVFLAHLGWREWVYGDWLPNTARVKVGLSAETLIRGSSYLAHFLATFPGVALALLIGLIWGREDLPTLVAVLASLAYPVLVGGDFMAFGRFVLPALPLACLLFARGASRLGDLRALLLAGICVGLNLLPAYDLHSVPQSIREELHVRHNAPEFRSEYGQWLAMKQNADRWRLVGQGLAIYTLPDATVVTGGIGAIGFFSGRFIYDQNGLVTREVALGPVAAGERSPGHDKAVPPEFFLKDSPTFLRVFLHGAGLPLPPEVVPDGPGRDLVKPLDPSRGFPPGYVLIGLRPR